MRTGIFGISWGSGTVRGSVELGSCRHRQRLPLLGESPPGRDSLPPTVCTAALLTVAKVSGLITCGRLVAGQKMPAKREAGKKVEATYRAQCWWEVGGGAGTKELPPSVSADTRTPEQGSGGWAGGALPRWALGIGEHRLGALPEGQEVGAVAVSSCPCGLGLFWGIDALAFPAVGWKAE